MIDSFRDYVNLHRHQIIKFSFIGVITFFINFLSFHFFYKECLFDYKISSTFAYLITVISHFTCHRMFTFKIKGGGREIFHNVGKYFIMLGINYFITMIVMWIIVKLIHTSAYYGVVAATCATALLSFFMMKYFVFSQMLTPPLKARA